MGIEQGQTPDESQDRSSADLTGEDFLHALHTAETAIDLHARRLVAEVDQIKNRVLASEPIPAELLAEGIAKLTKTVEDLEFAGRFAESKKAVEQPLDLANARILALSTAQATDGEYLTYARDHIRAVLGPAQEVTFVPFALENHDAYAEKVRARFEKMGITLRSVHTFENPVEAIQTAEAIVVGGGNTFRLLHEAHRTGVFKAIREQVEQGVPYIGSSAGSNLTMHTAGTTNDMPITERMVPEMIGLHFFPFALNPHYVQKVEGGKHLGESRDLRIKQFHEERPDIPVVGLFEGAGIQVIEGQIQLVGAPQTQAVLFRAGEARQEFAQNQDLAALVMTEH